MALDPAKLEELREEGRILQQVPEGTELLPRYEYKPWTPNPKAPAATTPTMVLTYASLMCLREGTWVKNQWYTNDALANGPKLARAQGHDPDDPFCNSWHACAGGMVSLAAIGAVRQISSVHHVLDPDSYTFDGKVECALEEGDSKRWKLGHDYIEKVAPEKLALYELSTTFLVKGINEHARNMGRYAHFSDVPNFNDNSLTTREDVVLAMGYGIRYAAQAEVEQRIADRMRAALDFLPPGRPAEEVLREDRALSLAAFS